MSQDRIIFGRPWFDERDEQRVLETLRSGWIGQGPLVERFERMLAEYTAAEHVVAVSSCTAALHLALVALGIGPGDEVITTPFTFVATVNAIEHSGATPVLVDIDPVSLNITPERVAEAITPKTAAIIPVHFGGRPIDVAGFHALAERHDLWIVEDAAHAVGGVAQGARIGGSGHPRTLACFSFYPNKNLASAEGGAIALADRDVAARLRTLRLHGLEGDAWARYRQDAYRPSLAVAAGFKYNWTDMQAALAIGQLEKLEGFLGVREQIAERYDELLADVPGLEPVDRGTSSIASRHALHLYQVRVGANADRDLIVGRMLSAGIGCAVHYIGVNLHPYYRERWPGERFPASNQASASLITLPVHLHLDDRDLVRVVDGLGTALTEQ